MSRAPHAGAATKPGAAVTARLAVGDTAPVIEAASLDGRAVRVPGQGHDPSQSWTLISFLRYASCPMCNLRMRELATALPKLDAAGVAVVVMLHSPPNRARAHAPAALACRVVADPSRAWYRRFGLAPSWARLAWSMLLPSFYVAWVKATFLGHWGGWIDGHFATMPADFLVGPDGLLHLVHYGAHIGDHADIDDVLALAAGWPVRSQLARRAR